jgi:single-strand DNA-binding protein
MGSVNRVILVGHLGRDADLRYTADGWPVSALSLATSEAWTDKSGARQERTEWHRVVLWGPTAESLAEYLRKGKQLFVEGRLQTREWTDQAGVKRWTTEVRADRVVLLGGRGEARELAEETADDATPARPPRRARTLPRAPRQSRTSEPLELDSGEPVAAAVNPAPIVEDDIPF